MAGGTRLTPPLVPCICADQRKKVDENGEPMGTPTPPCDRPDVCARAEGMKRGRAGEEAAARAGREEGSGLGGRCVRVSVTDGAARARAPRSDGNITISYAQLRGGALLAQQDMKRGIPRGVLNLTNSIIENQACTAAGRGAAGQTNRGRWRAAFAHPACAAACAACSRSCTCTCRHSGHTSNATYSNALAASASASTASRRAPAAPCAPSCPTAHGVGIADVPSPTHPSLRRQRLRRL